jgi:predicted esterase
MKMRYLPAVLVVLALFIWAGCSSTDKPGNDTGTGTGTTTGAPGETVEFPTPGKGSGKVNIYIPSSYTPSTPVPVIFLFNEQISDWQAIADANDIMLVDLDEYNDVQAYVDKLNLVTTHIEATYNVDQNRYHFAGWSAGGNIVVILGAQNQDFIASTMVFPGTGGSSAQSAMQSRSGHKIRLFYACGSADPNYDWNVVQTEANYWVGYGYTTHFDKVDGAEHYIDEATYHVRQAAWDWVKNFTKTN